MKLLKGRTARSLLVIAIAASVALPLAAFLQPVSVGRLLLVETRGLDPTTTGAEVIVDYGNGFALIRTNPLTRGLPAGILESEHPFGSRTFLGVSTSGYTFDTAKGSPLIPEGLRGTGGEYIVQFIGPIRPGWVRDLEARGFEVGQYFANYAFGVRGPASALRGVRDSPFVQWVGEYHPAYKIASDLSDNTGLIHASATGWPGVATREIRLLVESLGGEVTQANRYTVQFRGERGLLEEVARSPLVFFLDEVFPMELFDSRAGQIHGYHMAWDPTKSALPHSLTGRSPGPDNLYDTADDQFEGFGVQDTGFDLGDPNAGALDFFCGPSGCPSAAEDRVVRLVDQVLPTPNRDGEIAGSAHGTHVIGILASNGYAWERYLIEDKGRSDVSTGDKFWDQSEAGVAPEARLSIDGIDNGGGGVLSDAAYWDDEYADGYSAGNPNPASRSWFVTYSNSYGVNCAAPPCPYAAGGAGVVDTLMNADPERMVVFAAGNDGPNPGTISSSARAKNGLAIAASQNYRPDQFESDNPNLIADFSSRGPADSGRIKPDLAAVGTSVIANLGPGEWFYPPNGQAPQPNYIMYVDKYNYALPGPGVDLIGDYRYMQGTSMATPHASGMFALTREYLREVEGQNNGASPWYNPPSYAAKALMINGAVRMDPNLYAYPGPEQGWGRIDLQQSLFPPAPRTNQITIGQMTTNGICDIGLPGSCSGGSLLTGTLNTNVVSAAVPLKITLVWLEPTGVALARNLNLQVVSPSGTEYHGNQYTSGWSTPGAAAYDTVNNVEQVEIQSPEAGLWSVVVVGASIPSTAPFAVVIGADIGPQEDYRVDLSTDQPTSMSLAPGGSTVFPYTVSNFGNLSDTIALTHDIPAGLSLAFQPGNSFALASGASSDGFAVITHAGALAGVYHFDITATSQSDPLAVDFLSLTVEVLSAPLPSPIRVTNLSVDELDPSVVVFRDAAVGGGHIFIAYRKSTPVQAPPNDHLGGVNVWVAHATLDASGGLSSPFTHTAVSGMNENPNDLRLLRIPSGTYVNRIILSWTGEDPNATNADQDSWGRSAYLSPGSSPYYQGTWGVRTLMTNYHSTGAGTSYGAARISFPLFRRIGGAAGELYWVWEHLDYASATATNPTRVQVTMIRSTTGGESWPACGAYSATNTNCILIPPANTNFHFFPHGVIDQNDVMWIFYYMRAPTGNDRDLYARLYDGPWNDATPLDEFGAVWTVYETSDNIQWPAVLSTDEGPAGNRVYFVVTRDLCGTDLRLYLAYTDGDYDQATPVDQAGSLSGTCDANINDLSSNFTLLNPAPGPAGGLGTAISNANYNRRPILNLVSTTDAGGTDVWLPVMETATPYIEPNLWTWYSNPGFSNNPSGITKITADAFSKGHQMTSTLTSGSTGYLYEVWHANRGTISEVNYDVYLAIYSKGWETAPDNQGPVVTSAFPVPAVINTSANPTFPVLANINDVATGNNAIAAAEYQIDAMAWNPMTAWDVFNSPAEIATATESSGGLSPGAHQLCVRGQDNQSNWGSPTCVTFQVVTAITPPDTPLVTSAVLSGVSRADVTINWDPSGNEGGNGGPTDYEIWESTSYASGYTFRGTVAATGAPNYNYVCAGCGHGNVNNYFWKVRARNGTNFSPDGIIAAKYTQAVSAGRNLLAIPLLQADWSPATVTQTLVPSLTVVRTYRASDGSDPWKAYYAIKPGDLSSFQFGEAFWAEMSGAGRYTVAGLVEPNPSFPLRNGWNMVTYATPTSEQQSSSVGGLGVARMETYPGPADPYGLRVVPGTEFLTWGRVYWLHVTGGSVNWVQG